MRINLLLILLANCVYGIPKEKIELVRKLNKAALTNDIDTLRSFLTNQVIVMPVPNMEEQLFLGPDNRAYIGNGNYWNVLYDNSFGKIYALKWSVTLNNGKPALFLNEDGQFYSPFTLSFYIRKDSTIEICDRPADPANLAPKSCLIDNPEDFHPRFIDDRYDKYRVNGVLPEPKARDGHWNEPVWPPRN